MKVTLIVTDGPHRGARFEFRDHDTFLVGRSPDVQFRLPLKDKTLSRTHFLVEVNPPSCRLMDMASTNGVRVNGKVVHTADLRDGDTIQAGSTSLTFASESEALAAAPSDAPDRSTDTFRPSQIDWQNLPGPTPEPYPGYAVERKLGEGGMGVVYLARRVATNAPVALKVISPHYTADTVTSSRFLREASILRKLDHPGIVRFEEIGYAGGRLYFAMEYVDGLNLLDLLRSRGAISVAAAAGLACQVLDTLTYAHALGFVHRDIKPANLLLAREGGKARVKLADFGLARIYQESSLSGLSVTGQVGGTLAFMPPEQITHFREVKPPADIYAVGATLYHLLTSERLFEVQGRTDQIVSRILFDEPVPIRSRRPELPEEFAAIIHRALAKAPDDRFADAAAMRAALTPFTRPRAD